MDENNQEEALSTPQPGKSSAARDDLTLIYNHTCDSNKTISTKKDDLNMYGQSRKLENHKRIQSLMQTFDNGVARSTTVSDTQSPSLMTKSTSTTSLVNLTASSNSSTNAMQTNNSTNKQLNSNFSSSNSGIADLNDLESVKSYAYVVCKEYLGGIWKQIDLDQFGLEKITGGLSNYIFKCKIIDNDDLKPVGSEPKSVLLRIYGENHFINSSIMLKDVVVSAIMSDYKLGPKLYGIFGAGRLEEYIQSTTLKFIDLHNPTLSPIIASLMAKFHSLEMPFIKEPKWLFNTTKKYIKQSKEVKFKKEADIDKYNKLMSYDLENEFKQLRKVLESLNSPVVFCHNDIQAMNILKQGDKLMIIDYEYGSYNYRGFDFGNHFCEWMFDNGYEQYPYFQYTFDSYPNREQQLAFVRSYIAEMRGRLNDAKSKLGCDYNSNDSGCLADDEDKRQSSLDKIDESTSKQISDSDEQEEEADEYHAYGKNLDEEKLLTEANSFALASHLFWSLWSISQAASSQITFDYLEYALARCDAYFRQKKSLYPNGFNA